MKAAQVQIYCKIYAESFPVFEKHEKQSTGQDIMDFLLDDGGCAFSDDQEDSMIDPDPIPGDLNLWYLATNEKHGILNINGEEKSWGWGKSSWENVIWFVDKLYKMEVFSNDQYQTIMEKIDEGKSNFSFMYDIAKYLEAKRDGKPWSHPGTKGREESQKFFNNVKQTLENGGYKLTCPD